MSLNFTLFFFSLLFLDSFSFGQTTNGCKLFSIPSEEECGRVFISNLLVGYLADPPDAILIYPSLYSRDGKIQTTNSYSALIEEEAVAEFLNMLAHPTSIASADESCPNILIAWEEGQHKRDVKAKKSLVGRVCIYQDVDIVRIRLNTDDLIYPKIDFVYRDTGLKAWLEKRSTAQNVEKRLDVEK